MKASAASAATAHERAANRCSGRKADVDNAIRNNPMFYSCRKKYKNTERFKHNVSEKGLHRAVIEETGAIKYYYIRLRRGITKRIRKLLK